MEIGGSRTQAGSGKIVTYAVEYNMAEGTTGHWKGHVLLLGGHRHLLTGGVLVNVTKQTIAQAVNLALNAEIDALDFKALNAANGY